MCPKLGSVGTNSTTWIKRWAIKKRENCLVSPRKEKKHKINCFLNYTRHGVKKEGRKNFSQKFLSWFLHIKQFTSGYYYTPFFLYVCSADTFWEYIFIHFDKVLHYWDGEQKNVTSFSD